MAKLIIEAGRTANRYWADLWRYRELFFILAWRDISVRYKQTVIGIGWAILRPLLTMAVFTVVFGRIAKLPSDGIPYPLFVLAGMLPWQFFASALTEASGSLVENEKLITKVYFPRMIVPTSAVIVSLIDFLVSLTIAIGMFIWYRFEPSPRLVVVPILVLVAFLAALGAGLIITTLNVQYRDFRYVIPFIVQLGLYISPVGFSSSIINSDLRLLFSINPMVGIIDAFRWAIGSASSLYLPGCILSACISGLLLYVGVASFRRMEKRFADLI